LGKNRRSQSCLPGITISLPVFTRAGRRAGIDGLGDAPLRSASAISAISKESSFYTESIFYLKKEKNYSC